MATSTTRSVHAARTFSFGGGDRYVGVISDTSAPPKPFGAIIWGMGIGEMRVARALTKVGVTVMNITREQYSLPELDAHGADRAREAMDVFGSKKGIERFVFMGNCAFASISFHTALRDDRVVGLILANPHVSDLLSLPSIYRRKLLSLATWRQVLAGKVTLTRHLVNALRMKDIIVGRMKGLDERSLIAKAQYHKGPRCPTTFAASSRRWAREEHARTSSLPATTSASTTSARRSAGRSRASPASRTSPPKCCPRTRTSSRSTKRLRA